MRSSNPPRERSFAMSFTRRAGPVALALFWLASGLSAQGDAFHDSEARTLHAAARARWLEIDRSLIRYQAVVSQRVGVGIRMPLRDRSLLHHESAARVIRERAPGERGGVTAVQLLALSNRLPGLFLRGFEPRGDPLVLGIRTVELVMLPRRDDPYLLSGALWIEAGSGALVRAAYRLARPLDGDRDDMDPDLGDLPGRLRPLTVDVSLVAVDYALWDFPVWMPRSIRVEGTVRVGILSVPLAGEIAYEIEEVVTVADTIGSPPLVMGRRGGRMRFLIPDDVAVLQHSPLLPELIWSEDLAFVRPQEIAQLARMLAALPAPESVATVATFDWGTQRPDLVRYNRVEGVSVGARGAVRFGAGGAPLSAALTARLGSADLEPRGTLALTRETQTRSLTLSAYRELQLVEPVTRAFGVGNTAMALLFGRDDGDYYQATGAAIGLTPPLARRPWYRARAYVERQEPTPRETNESLMRWVGWDGGFRGTTPAAPADQAGIEVTLAPWWGQDPMRPGAGVELGLQAERGDFDFRRARAGGRASLPLPLGSRLALSAGGGTTWGAAPQQRLWTLGGPTSLRGFAPGILRGPSFLSGRGELVVPLSRVPAARAVGLALFMDSGWAGDRDRIRWDAAVASAGVGLSVLDGILRLDAAWGWHGAEGRRLDLYLDGLL